MTLILPLLISNGSWGSDLPECEGSPAKKSFLSNIFGSIRDTWDDCQGTFTYENGDQYVGEWEDGGRGEQGVFNFSTGDQYIGEFWGGFLHGQGTMIYANGDQYNGQWEFNVKWGQGTYTFANGIKKEGMWDRNTFLEENILIVNDLDHYLINGNKFLMGN